jgi:hypothetical protein
MSHKILTDEIPRKKLPKNPDNAIIGPLPEPEPIKIDTSVPFYRQDGFKRSVGFLFFGIGDFIDGPIGAALKGIGGLLGIIGFADAGRKSAQNHNGNVGLWQTIKEIVLLIINFFSKKGK